MATLDWRTMNEASRGGSDVLAVGLTAEQHTALVGSASSATWIMFSYLAETGGSVGRDRDLRTLYSEGATREDAVDRDEAVIKGSVLQTSARVMKLLDFLEDHIVACKRILPLKQTIGDATHQIFASERARLDKENWTVSTARQDQRTRAFTIRFFKADPTATATKPYVLEDIELADETAWPTSCNPFKEAAFAAA